MSDDPQNAHDAPTEKASRLNEQEMGDAVASVDWTQLANAVDRPVTDIIDGRAFDVGGDRRLEKFAPRDGKLLYSFGSGSAESVAKAVAAARKAFDDGRWSMLSAQQRKERLLDLATLIERERNEFALIESMQVGKPIRDAFNFDVPAAVATIRYNAEAADKLHAAVYCVDRSSLSYQLRRPLGVVGGITAWNFPLLQAASKIGPILTAGNTLVLKPSELTPLSTTRIAELAIEAGIPEGVLNVVHGDAKIGSALAHHHDVDCLSFTGSTATGKRLLVAAGESNMKRLMLECGGKAANIVFDDCPNLDAVVDGVLAGAFWNQGQVCTASSRLLVQQGIRQSLIERLLEKARLYSPGDPLAPDTRYGALVSRAHKDKVQKYVAIGEREGARRIYSPRITVPFENGFYLPPAIFDGVCASQAIAQEEIFGPLLSIIAFETDDVAVQIANSTMYGLSAILWTTDLGRAHRVSHALDVGWTVVNASASQQGGPGAGVLAVGGHRQSGVGLEGGLEGIQQYLSSTAVQIYV